MKNLKKAACFLHETEQWDAERSSRPQSVFRFHAHPYKLHGITTQVRTWRQAHATTLELFSHADKLLQTTNPGRDFKGVNLNRTHLVKLV
jgi:hypothetical protein